MMNRICWLHSRISHDKKIVVVLSDEIRTSITRSDALRKDDDCITILRADGNITVVNPKLVLKIYTTRREAWV